MGLRHELVDESSVLDVEITPEVESRLGPVDPRRYRKAQAILASAIGRTKREVLRALKQIGIYENKTVMIFCAYGCSEYQKDGSRRQNDPTEALCFFHAIGSESSASTLHLP